MASRSVFLCENHQVISVRALSYSMQKEAVDALDDLFDVQEQVLGVRLGVKCEGLYAICYLDQVLKPFELVAEVSSRMKSSISSSPATCSRAT